MESESRGPNTTIHRPGRQAFNTITTHAIVACSSGTAQISSNPPPPHHHHPRRQASHSPRTFFVQATPVIYSLNDKTQTSTHSSPESGDNHVTLRWGGGGSDTDVDLHKSNHYSQRPLLFFHRRAKKYTQLRKMQNMDRRRQKAGGEFLSLQPPHKASTITGHPVGSTEAATPAGRQGQRYRRDLVPGPSSHAPVALFLFCFFLVCSLLTHI